MDQLRKKNHCQKQLETRIFAFSLFVVAYDSAMGHLCALIIGPAGVPAQKPETSHKLRISPGAPGSSSCARGSCMNNQPYSKRVPHSLRDVSPPLGSPAPTGARGLMGVDSFSAISERPQSASGQRFPLLFACC